MDTVVFCARRSHSLMLRSAETVATRWLWGSNRHRVMQERWRSDQSKHTLTDAHRSIIADRATCDLSYRWRGATSARWRRRRRKRHSEDLQHKRPAGRRTRSCRRSAGRAASISTATKIIKMSQTQKSKKTKFIPCVRKSRNTCSEPSAEKCVQRITGRLLVWNSRSVTADVTRVSPVSRSQATIFLSQDTVTILTHTEQRFHSQVHSGYYMDVSALLFFVNFMLFSSAWEITWSLTAPWTMNKSSINSQRCFFLKEMKKNFS